MKNSNLLFIPLILFTLACQGIRTEEQLLFESLDRLPSAPQVEASNYSLGNKNILISGNKNGGFTSEGGISLSSINLLDGYAASIKSGESIFCLNNAESFTKYPFATSQSFKNSEMGIEVRKLEFISEDKAGLTLLYTIKNVDNSPKNLDFIFQPSTNLSPSILMDSTFGTNTPDQINQDELTGLFTAKDLENDWFAVWGSAVNYKLSSLNSDCMIPLDSLGASAGFGISITLEAGEEKVIPVFLAGSDKSEIDAMETLADLRLEMISDWDQNFALVDSLRKTAILTIPDKNIQAAYEWSKYKAGLFQFPLGDIDSTPLENPAYHLSFLRELSQNFPDELDKNIFSFDETKHRHIQPGWELIQPMTLSMLGILGDVENRVTYLRPNLPKGWKEISLENLWVEDNKLNISIISDENKITVEVTQTQKKAGLSIELPVEYSKVKVLGKEVSNDTKDGLRRILMTGDHVKIEAER